MTKICFSFNSNDPTFVTNKIIVNNTPNNFIGHYFITCPIYDKNNVVIGTKVADDYVQQTGPNEYYVRINSTYYFNDKSTISWQYCFVNNIPETYYPIGVLAESNVICTTGKYLNKKGNVKLMPYADGTRKVKICFD